MRQWHRFFVFILLSFHQTACPGLARPHRAPLEKRPQNDERSSASLHCAMKVRNELHDTITVIVHRTVCIVLPGFFFPLLGMPLQLEIYILNPPPVVSGIGSENQKVVNVCMSVCGFENWQYAHFVQQHHRHQQCRAGNGAGSRLSSWFGCMNYSVMTKQYVNYKYH